MTSVEGETPISRARVGVSRGDVGDGTAVGRTIVLPEELAVALEARVRGTSFPDVDAFVAFVLARLLESPERGGFTEEEERRLRERLRSLGYID